MVWDAMMLRNRGEVILRRAFCIFSGLILLSGSVLAGADEDYLAGLKSFRDGDVVGSMVPLRTAALAGHSKAQALLAEILDRSEFDEEAVELYRKSADQGDPDGMFGLGAMTAAGEGVKKDLLVARGWILKAAELGHKQAINVMAQAFLKGELGFSDAERNSPVALQWLKRAAENDDLPAIDALASAYGAGNAFGLAVDRGGADQYQAQANRIRNIGAEKSKKKLRRL